MYINDINILEQMFRLLFLYLYNESDIIAPKSICATIDRSVIDIQIKYQFVICLWSIIILMVQIKYRFVDNFIDQSFVILLLQINYRFSTIQWIVNRDLPASLFIIHSSATDQEFKLTVTRHQSSVHRKVP